MLEDKLLELIADYSDQMEEVLDGDIEDEQSLAECEKIYTKYIEAYEELLSIDFTRYAEEVINELYLLAEFYSDFMKDIEKAEKASYRRIDIYKKLAENDKRYEGEIMDVYENLAEIYENADMDEKAEEMYVKARKIYEDDIESMKIFSNKE